MRAALKREPVLSLIAVERKREAKRAESQRYRDRKKQEGELAERATADIPQPAESLPREALDTARFDRQRRRSEAGRLLPVARGGYAGWLDERDARVPLTRADVQSGNDDLAARVVAAGGGIRAVIEATGLRSLENVLHLIDPAILEQAHQNDAAAAAAELAI